MFFSAIVPYYVTVILTYHGVTEDAISSVGAEDVAGMEEAGSGVDLDLSILDILLIFLLISQFFPLFIVLFVFPASLPAPPKSVLSLSKK